MSPLDLIDQLCQAVDAHELDALVACFAADYRNETPAHTDRSFEGRAGVRANWERIFAGVPDITATIHRTATDGGVVWTEWEMAGTRPDGTPQLLRGPIIFGIEHDQIAWGRFYIEPVDSGEGGVDVALDRIVGGGAVTPTSTARDARPPQLLVRTMNPVMRTVLRTPIGRLVRPLALLEFVGRRSGRQFLVPVGYHELDRGHVVVTPAPWRVNFRSPHPVVVHFRGRRELCVGHLVDDPETVATALRELAQREGSLKRIGVDIPEGHVINAADVTAVDRALIEFERVCPRLD